MPLTATDGSWEGKTSSPRVRNIATCASHPRPWWKLTTVRSAGMLAEPMIKPGEVHGEEPRAVQGVGAAVGERRDGQRRDRIQAGGCEAGAAQGVDGAVSDHDTDEQADPKLANEQDRQIGQPVARLGQQVDEAQHQQHRDGVVQARLSLECLRQLARQRRAAKQREDRRPVGRRHDRPQQQPVFDRESE